MLTEQQPNDTSRQINNPEKNPVIQYLWDTFSTLGTGAFMVFLIIMCWKIPSFGLPLQIVATCLYSTVFFVATFKIFDAGLIRAVAALVHYVRGIFRDTYAEIDRYKAQANSRHTSD
jgi:hypothetical protein